MSVSVFVAWLCRVCDVTGRDEVSSPTEVPDCWYCGGPVVVTARPTLPTPPVPVAAS